VNRKRGRKDEHTFPTCYRANTPGDIKKLAAGAGFDIASIELVEGRPEYLRMFAVTYLCGAIYERAVNALDALRFFRVLLLAKLVKSGR
jgi:hypothetical protein